MTIASENPNDLVKDNSVHRRVYTDPALFEREVEHIFHSAWILLGHDSQIPEPGDFMLGRLGTKSVIVTRDKNNSIHVHENRCLHRGATVCSARSGRATHFTCPYHGWVYSLEGKLLNIPLKTDYSGEFSVAAHGLDSVPHVACYRGFIFASYRPPTELENFLGSAKLAFDDLVDRSPDGKLEAIATDLRYRVRANWKMVMENLNDMLHPLFAHASALQALKPLAQREDLNPVTRLAANAPPPEMMAKTTMMATPYGHSYMEGLLGLANVTAPQDEHFQALAAARGKQEAARILNTDIHVSLIYPSATINSRMQTIRLVRPLSVNETEVVAYVYRLCGAPNEVLDKALDYVWVSSSPSSFVVVDDFEIYERCQHNYETGSEDWISVDRSFDTDTIAQDGNLRGNGTSEGYIRNQYKVWSDYLADARL